MVKSPLRAVPALALADNAPVASGPVDPDLVVLAEVPAVLVALCLAEEVLLEVVRDVEAPPEAVALAALKSFW